MTLEASKRAVSCAACWPTDSMASQRGPAASQSPHSTCTSPVPTITALHLAICESPLIPTPTRACSPLSPPDRTSSAFPAMAAAEEGGFVFDLCKRNDFFEKQGVKGPGFTKTGTTIAGIIFKVRRGGAALCSRARRLRRRCHRHRTAARHSHPTIPTPPPTRAAGRRGAGRRHAVHCGHHRGRQELREDPLHRAQHLLLRRWHRRRHRKRDGHGGEPAGAAPAGHGHSLARRHLHDAAQGAPLQVRGRWAPGARWLWGGIKGEVLAGVSASVGGGSSS